jgi:hypothetical protein
LRLTVAASSLPAATATAQNPQAHHFLQLLLTLPLPRWCLRRLLPHCSSQLPVLLLQQRLLQQRLLPRTPVGCAAVPMRLASASAQSAGQPLRRRAAAHQLAASRQALQASP